VKATADVITRGVGIDEAQRVQPEDGQERYEHDDGRGTEELVKLASPGKKKQTNIDDGLGT